MASKDKLKIMLSFMREVNDGNMPEAKDYELTDVELWDIIDACQDAGLIKGARFAHGGVGNPILMCFTDGIKLTVKGMQYLHENSTSMKTYKGLKELRDWIHW